jgi:RNA polymerase sigma factor (sigma-70 family)
MRTRSRRRVRYNYKNTYYKPQGIPLRDLIETEITPSELETIRLRYVEGLSQTEAAKHMGVSQSQYQRDLVYTLKKLTNAIVNREAISIPDSD